MDESLKQIYKVVDEILLYLWDPIGVCEFPEARDEYESYVLHIVGGLLKYNSEQDIATILTKITTDNMGLSASPAHDLKIAKILISWKNYLAQN